MVSVVDECSCWSWPKKKKHKKNHEISSFYSKLRLECLCKDYIFEVLYFTASHTTAETPFIHQSGRPDVCKARLQ